jgi:hypothetical protein
MPILIDNFQVNTNAPIDNRFVVGPGLFYLTKDDINYKYVGLRVWDSNNSVPYYWDGTQWLSENSIGVLADTSPTEGGLPNYIAKFTDGPTTIGKSIIFENPATNQIGIGLVGNSILANVPGGTPLVNGLHVAGNIRTNSYFVGSGLHVTDINATNINSGLLTVNRISHLNISGSLAPGEEYVLFNEGTSNSVRWRAASGLSVLSSTNTTNISITEDSISTNSYITFVTAISGQLPLKINSSKMQFKPDNGQLFLSDGSASAPVYSFLNSNGGVNTGMYYDGYNINFSKQGNNFVSIVDNGIAVKSSQYPQIQFINTTTGKNRLLWVDNNDNLLFRLDAGQLSTEKRVWHQDNLFTLKHSGDLLPEINRSINSISYDAGGGIVKGVYTYNVKSTQITNIAGNNTLSQNTFFSVLSFGRGDDGSVQLASNWYGNGSANIATPGNVVADREILIRSLRDTGEAWSPWVKIWNSGNSGYLPFGAIIMWSGTIAQIPTGWRLCDGNNGTAIPILPGSVPGQPLMTSIIIPDLRERFVVGAGDNPTIPQRDQYDQFYYYHWANNATLTGTFTIGINTATSQAIPSEFSIDTTRLFYINSTGVGVQMTTTNSLQIGSLNIRPMIYTSTSLLAFLAFDMRINQYRMFKGTATNGTTYNTNYFTFNTTITNGLGTWVEYNKYFENGIRFNLPRKTGGEITGPALQQTILWQNSENGYAVGATGGSDMVSISQSQSPSHRHLTVGYSNNQSLTADNTITQSHSTGGNLGYGLHGSSTDATAGRTSQIGGNQAHENRPPYYALAFIIYTGI